MAGKIPISTCPPLIDHSVILVRKENYPPTKEQVSQVTPYDGKGLTN